MKKLIPVLYMLLFLAVGLNAGYRLGLRDGAGDLPAPLDSQIVIHTTGKAQAEKAAVADEPQEPPAPERSVSQVVPASDQTAEAAQYIANKRSGIFHRADCSYLPAEHNRGYFETSEEAENAGYRPCEHCSP